jgi:hypothetical protein
MVEFFFKIFFGLFGLQFINLVWLGDESLSITIGLLILAILGVIVILGKVEDRRYEADKELSVYQTFAAHRK